MFDTTMLWLRRWWPGTNGSSCRRSHVTNVRNDATASAMEKATAPPPPQLPASPPQASSAADSAVIDEPSSNAPTRLSRRLGSGLDRGTPYCSTAIAITPIGTLITNDHRQVE